MHLQQYCYVLGTIKVIGKQPDGDSVRFAPRDPAALDDIYRAHLLRPAKDGSHQLRLEGIDTPETHYASQAQPLGDLARDHFLKSVLGFESLSLEGEIVRNATPGELEAGILTASADIHGRPISYLLLSKNPFGEQPIGAITEEVLRQTANYRMVADGYAYPLLYSSAPAAQRAAISAAAKDAQVEGRGVWAVDHSDRFPLADLSSVGWRSSETPTDQEKRGLGNAKLVFPKIFRRACDFLASGGSDFVDWLTSTEKENDRVIVNNVEVPLSTLVRRENDRYRFDIDVTEAIFVER